jgi:hypothetical protein
MPQYLISIQHPGNYDPSTDEAIQLRSQSEFTGQPTNS